MKRTILAICLGLAVIVLMMISVVLLRSVPRTQEFTQAEFVQKLQSNLIARGEVIYTAKASPINLVRVRGEFYQTDSSGEIVLENGHATVLPFRASVRITEDLQRKLLANTNFAVVERRW